MTDIKDIKFKDAPPWLRRELMKIVAKLVNEGVVEYTIKDGEPAIRQVEKKP